MATLVCFHAHPDDEAIATGGAMAKASAAGHRVVLVIATRGEHGEIVPGVLAEGEQLGIRRVKESYESAAILGAGRVEFLGYIDSGMMGEPENDAPGSFWSADVEHAAERLATILREERADVLTIYDDNGGYGHPDHIQVHRVGLRAAEIAGVPRVFEATINRDHVLRGIQARLALAPGDEERELREQLEELEETPDFGVPEGRITHAVDVTGVVDLKRRAMRAHASQIPEESFFLTMDDATFAVAFGTEWFIASGATRRDGEAPGEDLLVGIED
ncbi:MAG: 1D-myo-inositol 2-acetamido-2-deoxy-alpha-D-glucopyranoside deacetylase [Acidimicrobiales bacterium]|nr:MAG: GlcNAc-PI de-N-acetylase [Actinomycetota bacterium]MBV6508937.1 1D-myo-inositol 2-acetamido-2-deoxy-alpha-D-glucopyranoside deacetylase [Acidimicrobiales bacterium]RIK08425.1 MAG: GlcNAc-PI de-N-acetylase [Acidobacteriota bacterium]